MAVLLFPGCSKDSGPTETPLAPGTSTIITGTVKDSSGNPIDSAAIKIKYYFTVAAKQSAKASPCSVESFTAVRVVNGVQLNWVTESEVNTLRWEIERSLVADTDFVVIGILPAAGNSSSVISYTYTDTTASATQTYYYRLCLVDVDGAVSYFGPIGLGPAPIYPDEGFSAASPCPFSGSTTIGYSLVGSSQVSLTLKQKGQAVRTLINQTCAAGFYLVTWDGKDNGSIFLASGYFVSELTISRHDSTFCYTKPVFINIVDSSTARVNTYTDAQGAFTISDIPVDSVFNMRDVMGTDLGNVKVCDSVTVYAVKNGYAVNKVTFVLGKNTTSAINFIIR